MRGDFICEFQVWMLKLLPSFFESLVKAYAGSALRSQRRVSTHAETYIEVVLKKERSRKGTRQNDALSPPYRGCTNDDHIFQSPFHSHLL